MLLLSEPSSEDEKYTRLYIDFQERNSELLHAIAFLDRNSSPSALEVREVLLSSEC